MDGDGLAALRTFPQYREDGREHVFPSPTSLEWSCRKHRRALVEAGALVLVAGRRMLNPPLADAVFLAAARHAMLATLADEADA